MNKLFIYYSLTSNGDMVADSFKKKGYDIRKVISKKKYPKSKFFMIMTGGYRATFDKRDKLVNFDTDISAYDKIVIGSPVWADKLCSPINTVLDTLDLKGKDVSFALYSGSGEAVKAKETIKSKYGVEPIMLKEPKRNWDELLKIKDL